MQIVRRDAHNKQSVSKIKTKAMLQVKRRIAFVFISALTRVKSITSTLLHKLVTALAITSLFVPGSVLIFGLNNKALAAESSYINFQARILQASGALVPDGTYHVEFKLYYVPTSGTALWTETRDKTTTTASEQAVVKNGYISVRLGAVTAFPSTINWDQELYLGMNIGGTATTPAWDGEMNPRFIMTSVPYAKQSKTSLGVTSNNTSSASTNSSAVSISTGNASGTTSNSGNITIDSGTATGTTGTISIAGTNASGLTLARSGLQTTIAGNALVQGGTLTVGTTSQAGSLVISDGSSNTVTLTSSGVTTNYSLTLPAAAGTTDQCLRTDSSVASQLVFGSCGTTGAVTSVGGIDTQTKSGNGAVIASGILYMQTADATNVGLVSTGVQTFAGNKTFAGNTSFNGTVTVGAGAVNGSITLFSTGTTAPTLTADATGNLNINAANGTVVVGKGSGGIDLQLTNVNDLLTGSKTFTAASGYSSNDFTFTRTVTGGANALSGSVFYLNDASTTSSTNTANILNINTASGTGNLILATTGGSTTRFQVTAAGNTTVGGNLTVGSGAGVGLFTNNGATLNATLAITDKATGSIGTAATTVDIYTSATINQTTAGQSLTVPNPTTTTAGRMFYLSNIGTASFTLLGTTINAGTTASLIWTGTAWQFTGADGSGILNQNSADQTANFRISGTGRANTSFTSPLFDSITGTLSVGTSTATGVTIGGTTNTTAVTLQGAAAATYTIGTNNGTGTITLGQSTTATSALNIQSANATASTQTINIGGGTSTTSGGKIVNIANGVPGAGTTNTVAIGTGGSTTGTVGITIGSATAANHTLLIQGGNVNTAGSEAIRIQTSAAGGIAIGTAAQTGTITLGQSTAGQTIAIGNAVNTGAQTINIANGASGANSTVNILSGVGTAGTGTLNLGNNTRVNAISIGNINPATARTISIGNTTATANGFVDTINIATNPTTVAGGNTVNIGTGTPTGSGTNLITIGSIAALANTTTIQGGNGSTAIQLQTAAAGSIAIGTAAQTGTITLGQSTAGQTIAIGNAVNTGAQTINIANGASGANSTVNILSGVGTAGTGTLNLGNNTRVNAISIGNVAAAAARTINLGSGSNTVGIDTINIGTGATTVAGGKTINIGNGTPTGSGTNLITIGSTANASTTTINAGSGGITANGATNFTNSVALKKGTDIATAGTSTNNLSITDASLIKFTGTLNQTITGIAGGRDGRILTIVNASTGVITLTNSDTNSLDGNRITSGMSGNLTLEAGASMTLVYDSTGTAATSFWRVTGGGVSTTLQEAYTYSGAAEITLDSTRGGLTLRNATSDSISTNLFEVQNNAGTATFFGVTSSAMNLQDSSGNLALSFDSTTSELKVYDNVASPTKFARIYYASDTAVFAASSGTTQIGGGTGGNIQLTLNSNADQLLATKSTTPAAAYSLSDFNFTRNLTGTTFALTGSVLRVEDTSTVTTGSSSPNVLLVNQNNTAATGNLILAQTGGSTTRFQVTTAGDTTVGGTLSVTGNVTANANLTVGSGAGVGLFTNNGATVNTTLALSNFATNSAIGTAAATVDIYTSASVAQTTAGVTLTIPTPTASTTYGRIFYISNIGTTSFTLLGASINPGTTTTVIWANTNGAASWQFAGADGSGILNQNTSTQTANFQISGTGTAGVLNATGASGIQTAGTTRISNTGALSNVTADTAILTSGTLGVARGGTGAATFTTNGVLFGNGTGAIQATAAGTTGQCLVATTGSAPSWGTCGASGTFLNKNSADTSSAAITASNYLYTFTNSSSAVASGVLSLSNGNNTGNILNVVGTGNGTYIFANNTNASPSGNLIDLQSSSTSRFSVTTAGAVTASGLITGVGYTAGSGLIQGAGGLTVTGNTSLATTAGNTFSAGNSTGAVTLTGSNGSTFVFNGVTVDVTEFNRLDGKDAALVDTNDAVNTAITGTGALASGSIASGFGTISTGNNITTTATVQGGTVNATSAIQLNGTSINTSGTLSNVAYLGGTQTFSAANTFSATSDALVLSGTPSASATASVIRLGTAISGGSANGTYIGSNPASFSGDFINMQVGGAVRLKVTNTGATTVGNTLTVTTGGITVSSGGVTVTGNSSVAGSLAVTSAYGALPSAGASTFILGGGGSSPNSGSLAFGDNTGWKFSLGTNVSSTYTPRVTFMDTGNVGIGDTTPAALLTVGNGDLFQVNSSGAIAAAAGITSTGTIAFSGAGNFSVDSSAFDVTTAGAVSGVTTLGLSGAITGATTTNTINGLIINAGALSGITGYSQTSGNFAMSGTGTFGTGTGAVSLNGNTTIASGSTLTVAGTGATSLGGTLAVTGNVTANANLTVGSAAGVGLFTNNGATVNTTLALSNFATNSAIGTAAATVDIYTSASVAQTTAGVTLTIPTPTASTTYGRMFSLSNIGTASFTLLGIIVNPGNTASLIWQNTNGGASWQFAGGGGVTNGITTVGAISGTSNANGATVSGLTLSLTAADFTNGGVLTSAAQNIGGAKTFNSLITGNLGLTVGSGAGVGLFTNNGATVNTVYNIGNLATGGWDVGGAAATVDKYTYLTIAQTTASQTVTVPSPTANSTFGRVIYLSNIGTASFTLLGASINPGTTTTLIWANTNGAASWQFAGADGSGILNQNSADQTANFRISGTGRANTSFTSPLFDSITGTLSVGTSTATGVTVGGTTNTTAITLQGAAAATYTIGTSNNTGGITVGNSTATNIISIGSAAGASATQTINIGTSSTASSTTNVTIGSTVAGTTVIQGSVRLAALTSNGVVKTSGNNGALSIAAVALGSEVSGTLGVTNGGTGTATQFTQGSLVFAGASGVYSQNNSNLFWDNTNSRLGVGTSSTVTGARLTIIGSDDASMAAGGANINIGGSSKARVGSFYNSSYIAHNSYFTNIGGTGYAYDTNAAASAVQLDSGAVLFMTGSGGTAGTLVSSPEKMRLTNSGNLGIGDSTPAAMLTVGSGDLFQVNSSGAIAASTGYTQTSGNFAMSGTGTFGTGTGAISLNGATSITGSNTLTVGTGLTTLGGGLTVTGAAISLNDSSNFNVSIAGGTSTGTVNIGTGTGVQSLNFGTGGTGAKTVAIGSTASTGSTTINAGSGGITANGATNFTNSVALKKGTDIATAGTSTNNLSITDASLIKFTGTLNQTITGIAGGRDGRILTIVNASTGVITLTNSDTNSLDGNRITSGMSGNLTLEAGASMTLVYDSTGTAATSFWRVTGGGVSTTLQEAYTYSGAAEITLDSTRGGLTLRNATSDAITGNLFELQNNAGTLTYLGVTPTSLLMKDADNQNTLEVVNTASNHELRVYDATGTNYAIVRYDGTTAIFAASSGTTQIGTPGSGGNISLLLTAASDQLLASKTPTLNIAANYSTSDFNFTRNLTGTTFALTGSVLKVEDTSSFTTGSSSPNVLLVNQNNTSATGNLILAQTGGSTTRFQVTTAGNTTVGGTLTVGTASSVNGQITFNQSTSANSATIQAPTSALASSYTLTLPSTAGTANQCLQNTSVAGVLTFATCALGTLTDNITNAFNLQEGTNNYININTTNAAENISLGNTTTNPSFSFLGTGNITLGGNVLSANSVTANTGTTTGTGTNTTTLTLTANVAGFANNDILFIDNVGQDYYTRIVSGAGTATLTVSPAVTFETGRTVTEYQNVRNIGASNTDYTTQTQRFFQGYFLGGVVTGTGSTTLSDGLLTSTGALNLRVGSTVSALSVTSAGAATLANGLTVTTGGATVSAGNLAVTAGDITTAGTVRLTNGGALNNITGYTQSSGTFALTSAATTGNVMAVTASSLAPAAAATGNGSLVTVGQAAANTTGNSIVNAYSASMTLNASGAGGTKDLTAFNANATTLTACTGGNCTVNGLRVATQSTGALATITQNGLNVQAAGIALGSLNGLNISAITGGAGTETAINIGSGWDNVLSVNGTAIINATGVIQSAGISGTYGNLTGTGALVSGSIASGFGTILTGNTITGTTLNGTTGINTGASAGTQRIDASGNLVNIGTITSGLINGQTISSSANFTGTLAVNGSSLTLGTASTTTGTILLRNSGGSGGITLTTANPGANNFTITLPAQTGTICTTGSVCSGYQASGSYLTVEADTLATVTARGATTSSNISTGDLSVGGTFYTVVNSQSIPTQTSGTAITWNYTAGYGNTNFWNLYTAAANESFTFYQKTTDANNPVKVMSISTGGQIVAPANILSGASLGYGNITPQNAGSMCRSAVAYGFYIAGHCTSLAKYKDEVQNLPYGLETIRQLRPVQYKWNIDTKDYDTGFIAEEVNAIAPIFNEYSDGKLSGVKYDHMVSLAINGIKILDSQVQNMEGRLAVVESGVLPELHVTGDAEIGGSLTVTGDTFVQNITVNGKIITAGNAPTIALGSSAKGVNANATVTGNDIAGSISFEPGTKNLPNNTVTSGEQIVITFDKPYTATPRVTMTPTNEKAASIRYFVEKDLTSLKIKFIDTPEESATYTFDYQIIQ